MDIIKYRPLFNIFIVDGSPERQKALSQILGDAGYEIESCFGTGQEALDAIEGRPPHVVLYALAELPTPREILEDGQFVAEVLDRVPESHVILVCPNEELEYGLAFYDKGVFDVLGLPLEAGVQLVQAVDRAIQIDYYNYLNEQMREDQAGQNVQSDLIQLTKLYQWGRKLHKLTSLAQMVPLLCDELQSHSDGLGVLFFKYIESQGTLVASYSAAVPFEKIRGLGIDLLSEGDDLFRDQLFLPASIASLKGLIKDLFGDIEYCAQSLVQMGTVKGVVVTLGVDQAFSAEEYVRFIFGLIERHVSSIESVKRLSRMDNRDSATKFLLRPAFLDDIRLEISRARRIELPISLLVFDIQAVTQMGKPLSDSDHKMMIEMVATIFRDNCRIYDRKGRMGINQFAILLPHANQKDGAIKGERLRRVLESANYNEIIPAIKAVTVCVGVSEYPSLSSDPDDMLLTADEALSLVADKENGRVCLASARENFTPDFFILET